MKTRRNWIGMALLAVPTVAKAQDFPELELGGLIASGDFWVAIVGGLVLAVGFQMLLTTLSGAAGLSALSTVTSNGGPQRHSSGSGKSSSSFGDATHRFYEGVRSVSAGFGVWTIITASLALFFAAWLAVELSGAIHILGGIVLGLVIWALFYLFSVTVETAAISSMVGSLAGVIKETTRSAARATASIFEKSEPAQQADQAAAVTAAVKEELIGKEDLTERLSSLFQKFEDKFAPEEYRKELEKLLKETEVQSFIRGDILDPETMKTVHELKVNPAGISKDQARSAASSIKNAVSRAKDEMGSDKPRSEKAVDAAMRAGGMSSQEAEAARNKVEDYLRRTGKEELDPDGIKRDIEKLFSDPSTGAAALSDRIGSLKLDRETLASVMAARQDMTREEADRKAGKIMTAVESIIGKAQGATSSEGPSTKQKAMAKVEGYLASLDRPSGTLDPAAVRHDLDLLFHDPKAGAEALLHRAKTLDRQDVVALLESKRGVDRAKAEGMVDEVMQARDRAIAKAEHMQAEVQRRLDEARDEVVHQADEMRKTAASAAWWMLGSGVCSALAAAIGGWLAVLT